MTYHEQHSGGIGSAEIAAVCGLDPYRSRLAVWQAKRGELPDDAPGTWHADRGVFLEPALVRWLGHRAGIEPRPSTTYRRGIIIATPDAETVDAVVEVKSPSRWAADAWGPDGSGPDGVPARVICQVQWQLAGSGRRLAYVGALIDDFMRVYRVPAHEALIASIQQQAERFWRCVQSGDPPTVEGNEAGAEWLKVNLPQHRTDDLLDVSGEPEIVEAAEALRQVRADEEVLRVSRTAIENAIKSRIGEHSGISGRFGKITWRTNRPSSDYAWDDLVACLKTEHPDLLARFAIERPGARVFRPWWKS